MLEKADTDPISLNSSKTAAHYASLRVQAMR